ncbi:bifunctional diaminohydroxyphosphoribosylaminopyrimidine deaminase/5-amino-6-(5-phosphoribosylamino)uracil reductase RibD [Devosia sp. RR2S18]|uniref:bifunctional diaminohydroxyphosphoribosylaminopyrimidine deaminase/5-amino-6-(5-phosphoribosylamino)uracil reductase RibD n=1 Tax=Devosia rhizosphaerae TaxID=3049774 RepID=UPI002540BEC5|nr:bifunctional diaminohydroxyphosphoribosylaminopyrimidine deaminase/5-amino-6-(5-phosphoribosylamino)uracil reductase RibD [Devosia sp. RR2S18]WIJ23795.1 bifunctional diaminohydroxyphosphoribosylaminopyrimidine deaminase/5-amino-6-(5-phosphoribosylamino)uracil reductase RibD [Devosia sp. RR2S18]
MGRNQTDPNLSLSGAILARAFARAIEAAKAFEGATAPNPPVGCVLLDAQGNELAIAAHQKAGERHAEALAISLCRQAGLVERIHTVVVTLEPCNHTGRTPPCTDAILSTPARAVWIGSQDPNDSVVGSGGERLRDAGLEVHYLADLQHPRRAELLPVAERLIAPFHKRIRTGLPWVTVKRAVRPDGSMIPPAGQKTFTSPRSLTFAHHLRRRADVIATGSGTILADNPEFTVRHVPDVLHKHRLLAIFDRERRVPAAYLNAARERGFSVSIEDALPAAFRRFAEEGALEVLVEAGPRLTAEVLKSSLWDELILIEQGGSSGSEDRITIHPRDGALHELTEKDHDVLGHN